MANLPDKRQDPTLLIRVARPVHWIKNLSIFAALIFTGGLFDKILFGQVFLGFIAFNLAVSGTYIFNDIQDAAEDRLHPIKRRRPVASGELPVWLAAIEIFILVSLAFYIAFAVNSLFSLMVLFYLGLQATYSLGLKNIAIFDILIIASGFIIRTYAGAFIIDAHLSVWFLLCVVSASLFLASGKRRAELNLIEGTAGVTRKSLTKYSEGLLNSYVTMFGNAAWMSWALFTFFESPGASLPVWLFLAEVSKATTISKLLMITIPVVIFGIMRYEALIFEGKSEAPEKVLLSDRALIASVGIWTLLVITIFYGGLSA